MTSWTNVDDWETSMTPKFTAGRNIAMKVPSHEFNRTVAFYRDVLGFEEVASASPGEARSVTFEFGDKQLWIDAVAGLSQAELWLEIVTEDVEAASRYLEGNDCVRRDEIEPLPVGFKGFWVANPANVIHLVTQLEDDSTAREVQG